MATTAEAAAHIFLTAARFHDLVAQGVIAKAERGAYDLNRVREEYIKNIRKSASGHGKDAAGLSEARAELTREQTIAVALKNAVTRSELVRLATVQRGAEIIFAAFRERCLSIPGKIAAICEMRSRGEVEETVRAEIYECLEELSGPILPVDAASWVGGIDAAVGHDEEEEIIQ